MSGSVAQPEVGAADAAASPPRALLCALREFAHDLLCLPVMALLIEISVVRHELCHALGAAAVGVPVTEIVVWPSNLPDVGFRADYVTLGPTSSPLLPLLYLAPYVFSIITFPLFCWLYASTRWRWEWTRMSFAFLGLYYPISELILAFGHELGQGKGDVGVLLTMMPAPAVYALGAAGCVVYVAGIMGRMVHDWPAQPTPTSGRSTE